MKMAALINMQDKIFYALFTIHHQPFHLQKRYILCFGSCCCFESKDNIIFSGNTVLLYLRMLSIMNKDDSRMDDDVCTKCKCKRAINEMK